MFLGIDASLRRTGLCFSNGATYRTLTLEPPDKMRGPERLNELVQLFREAVKDIKITAAAVEGYAMGGSGRVFDIAEWGGILKLILWKEKIPTIIVAPQTVKKYLIHGGAEKNQMLLEVYKKYGVHCPTDDEADALVLSDMAKHFYRGPEKLVQRQLEALQKAEILIPKTNPVKAARRVSRDR